jgi:uncharacterized protein (DUF1015 family)
VSKVFELSCDGGGKHRHYSSNLLKGMEVSPFRAVPYNARIVGDLAEVICPPYDVITPEQQELYYQKSDYNAIRLEFPEPTGHRYQTAAMTLQQWLKQGVLQYDRVPSFYLHDHHFDYSGERRVRRGLIARVELRRWGSGVYPHEETSSQAKNDRLQLMRACRADFSPLLSLYDDSDQKIAPILSEVSRARPVIETLVPSPSTGEVQSEGGEARILWAITDPEIKGQLARPLSGQPVYIADGHHRYETALVCQQERAHEQSVTGKEALNYVMMELVKFSDPGLVVLPLHRLVRGIAPSVLAGLGKQLENFFTLEFVSFSEDFLRRCHHGRCPFPVLASPDFIGTKQSSKPQDMVLGILGLRPGALALLGLRQDVSLEAMMPANRSQVYRQFNVSVLNHIVLDKVLGGVEALDIAYTVDLNEAREQISEGRYQLAFLLPPPQPEVVKAVADAHDRLPRKSTYFYPKAPAGLVINPLG